MSEEQNIPVEPLHKPARTNGGNNWSYIGVAIGTAASILAAAFTTYSSGGASRSATRALTAEESVVIKAYEVQKTVAITEEMLERARNRAADMEARIGALEKRIAAIEGKGKSNAGQE